MNNRFYTSVGLGGFKKFFLLSALVLAITILASSCAQTVRLSAASTVPAAEGKVKIKRDGNKNYRVKLEVVNLAGPEKLTPPRGSYVVWMYTEQDEVKNLGQLTTSTGLLSSTLKGDISTVTPFKPVRIIITAEDNPRVQTPGTQVVMSTANFN